MVAIAVLTVVLNYVDDWTFEVGNLINEHVIGELESDPRETHTRFGEIIAEPEEDADQTWYEEIFNFEASIAKALGYFLIWLAAKVAWLIVWWAYFIQKGLLYFGLALSPIFLPMLLLNATKGIAVRYIMGLLSILVWPLGWAVANLMTDALLQAGADNTIYEYGGVLGKATYGPQMIFFLLLASLWLVFSTIAAPVIIGERDHNRSPDRCVAPGRIRREPRGWSERSRRRGRTRRGRRSAWNGCRSHRRRWRRIRWRLHGFRFTGHRGGSRFARRSIRWRWRGEQWGVKLVRRKCWRDFSRERFGRWRRIR